jgi:hypothetical protein
MTNKVLSKKGRKAAPPQKKSPKKSHGQESESDHDQDSEGNRGNGSSSGSSSSDPRRRRPQLGDVFSSVSSIEDERTDDEERESQLVFAKKVAPLIFVPELKPEKATVSMRGKGKGKGKGKNSGMISFKKRPGRNKVSPLKQHQHFCQQTGLSLDVLDSYRSIVRMVAKHHGKKDANGKWKVYDDQPLSMKNSLLVLFENPDSPLYL